MTSQFGPRDLEDVQDKLFGKLEVSKAWTDDDSDEFLPRTALTEVLTNETIQLLLQQKPETREIRLADITGKPSRIMIFATLLLMGATEHIGHVIRHEVSDHDLPLTWEHAKTCLESKDRLVLLNNFFQRQFTIAVPLWNFSSHNILRGDYHYHQKLPLLEKCRLSSGGHGAIWKVKIHPGHFQTRVESNRWECLQAGPYFALKEFGSEYDFQNELDALEHFNQSDTKHEHLIRALVAYSQNRKHFLIFPLAKGNLDQYWQESYPSTDTPRDPSWLLAQCRGLAQGLERIHEYDKPSGGARLRGRHGDIKPQNVLWFEDPSMAGGRLVFSDFTLMRFHVEGSNKNTTIGRIGGTRTYRAPEVASMSGSHVSQKYDIWSLGCVFLEFVSCHLVGYEATRKQRFKGDDDHFYESFPTARWKEDVIEFRWPEDNACEFYLYDPRSHKAKVKSSVENWFSFLHSAKHCSSALHDFLKIIQDNMLQTDPERRWPIQQVREGLDNILDRNLHGDDIKYAEYHNIGKPWKASFASQFPEPWDEQKYNQSMQRHSTIQSLNRSELTGFEAVDSRHSFGEIVDIPVHILPGEGKNLNGAEGTDTSKGVQDTLRADTRWSLRNYGLTMWEKARSVPKRYLQAVLKRDRLLTRRKER